MRKTINVTLDEEKFWKWLKKNNKVRNKRAIIEYLAENGNEPAKETLKRIESGNLDPERIEMSIENDVEEIMNSITDRNIKGMKYLYKAIILIASENPEEYEEEMKTFTDDILRAMYCTLISRKHKEILDIIEEFGKLMKIARITNAFIKANDKDDEDMVC